MIQSILHGEAIKMMQGLAADSVHCIITSPPYWRLRDYICEGQLGLEPDPETYITKMVEVFRAAKRILRPDGVLWVNLGDSYWVKPPRESITITLTDEEKEMVTLLAHARNSTKERHGIPANVMADHRTVLDIHQIGIAAEVAVAKYYGVLPSFYLSLKGDKGKSDLIINGQTCEVKCRTQKGYDFALMSSDPSAFTTDLGVLVYQLAPSSYEIHGVISQARFKRVCKIKDYGHGKRATAAPECFSHASTLNHKHGTLVGIPWKLALALQKDGWYFRRDNIWFKPNPMPESVNGWRFVETDEGHILKKGAGRCATAHEYLFHFTKTPSYFFDCEAVRESTQNGSVFSEHNKRSVWEIPCQSSPTKHFSTFPDSLVESCIKAGTSQKGCCPTCGSPWARILEPSPEAKSRLGKAWHNHEDDAVRGNRGAPPALKGPANITKGWLPTCECNAGEPIPCTVLDCFAGSGTVGAVAVKMGRSSINIELNSESVQLALQKITEAKEQAGQATAEDSDRIGKPMQLGLLGT